MSNIAIKKEDIVNLLRAVYDQELRDHCPLITKETSTSLLNQLDQEMLKDLMEFDNYEMKGANERAVRYFLSLPAEKQEESMCWIALKTFPLLSITNLKNITLPMGIWFIEGCSSVKDDKEINNLYRFINNLPFLEKIKIYLKIKKAKKAVANIEYGCLNVSKEEQDIYEEIEGIVKNDKYFPKDTE